MKRPVEILEKTIAATTVEYNVDVPEGKKVILIASGDLGTDNIPIKYVGSDGSYTQAYNEDEEVLQFTQTRPNIPFDFSCTIAFVKGVTTNAVGIDIHGEE